MTTTTTTPTAISGTVLRPVATTDDSFAAGEILTLYTGDELWKLDELVPGGTTYNAVALAEDGSFALFDVYARADWEAMADARLTQVLLVRQDRPKTPGIISPVIRALGGEPGIE